MVNAERHRGDRRPQTPVRDPRACDQRPPRMTRRRRSRTALTGVTLLAGGLSGVLTGCAPEGDDAQATAEHFVAAVADGDGARACGLLTAAARAELEQSSGKPCPEAVVEEAVPDEPVKQVSVFETVAETRSTTHAVFLARSDAGWRVQAAACTPVTPDRPYDCSIQGG